MKLTQHKSDILDPKPVELGFTIGKNMEWAAVPVGGSDTKLAVIHDGKVLKVCRNRKSAINFIEKYSKTK